MPLYGKFADIVGRRPVMFLGIAAFLIGSVLCGVAWSMPALIAFRAVQGLGAGAVQPIALTIVGDLYSVEERARVQGYLASVWGISAVVGPTLGGLFSQYLSWRWIFFVNLPLGAVAWVTLSRRFKEQVAHRKHTIDWAGAAAAHHRLLARDPRPARGRRRLGVGLDHKVLVSSRWPALPWCRSCSSSGGPQSRSCRCGSSGDASSSAATWCRSASARW